MKIEAITKATAAYGAARWRARRLRSREVINAYQTRRLQKLMQSAARHLPFYHDFAVQPFRAWPVIDKGKLLDNFAAMNRAGLSLEGVRAALAHGDERMSGQLIGMSTGTSGNRGYYVITEAERFAWLGTILAKALPGALWRRHKVALALPALSELYSSATRGSRIDLRFFDLAAGPETWCNALRDFAPDTIVAPPKVLRWLVERDALAARHIFSGAEVLDPLDRNVIEAATGHRVREIYMATEGLFGVACPYGTLHLAEDVVHFEFERPDAESPLVVPIVTDFTRRAQGMIRYRMNDLLELDEAVCPCGSSYRAVKRIEGRQDDCFLLADACGELQMVTPDTLRNAVVDSDSRIPDFRIVQTGKNAVEIHLPDGLTSVLDTTVRGALQARLARRGLTPHITVQRGIAVDFSRKLRRVRREWDTDTHV